jgi:hypothetical protein
LFDLVRWVVGYAVGRSTEAQLAVSALEVAVEHRHPPPM